MFVDFDGEEVYNCLPEKSREAMFVKLATYWKTYQFKVYEQEITRIMYLILRGFKSRYWVM